MAIIEVTDKQAEFLREVQHEMKTQNQCGTSNVYFVIAHLKEVPVYDGCDDECDDGCDDSYEEQKEVYENVFFTLKACCEGIEREHGLEKGEKSKYYPFGKSACYSEEVSTIQEIFKTMKISEE